MCVQSALATTFFNMFLSLSLLCHRRLRYRVVTKRRESSNPSQKQHPESLKTQPTVQLCQLRSLFCACMRPRACASLRPWCPRTWRVHVPTPLRLALCGHFLLCFISVAGWLLLGQAKAEIEVDLVGSGCRSGDFSRLLYLRCCHVGIFSCTCATCSYAL